MNEKEASLDQASPLTSHLLELKRRMTIAVVVYLLGVLVLMNFSDVIYDFISRPLRQVLPPGSPMVFIGAPDVFFTYLKVALLVSLFATSPVTLYQIWAFVAPGLYRHERRAFLGYLLSSIMLLLAGGAFAYFVVFPLAFKFFLGFANEHIQALPAVKEYLSFALKLLFAFGLSFQIPIILMMLSRLELVDPESLAKKRRFVILWVFVAGALLTPPDAISQVMLAVPMLVLFEVGLFLARMGRKRATRLKAREEEQERAEV